MEKTRGGGIWYSSLSPCSDYREPRSLPLLLLCLHPQFPSLCLARAPFLTHKTLRKPQPSARSFSHSWDMQDASEYPRVTLELHPLILGWVSLDQ